MGRGGSGLINELIHQCVQNWMDKGDDGQGGRRNRKEEVTGGVVKKSYF